MQAAMNALNPVVKVGEQVAEPLLVHAGWKRAAAASEGRRDADPRRRRRRFHGPLPVRAFGRHAPARRAGHGPDHRAELVILDEPTSALDLLTQASIMNVLKRIKWETGTSFILITHDVGTSSELVDHVALMYAGQIVETSPARDFFREPAHPYGRA
jgi:peptide/nickel transport system ATP-binding protein